MRVAYVYDLPANDITVQSGRPFSILKQLQQRTVVEPIFPLNNWLRYAYAPKYMLYRGLNRTYRPDREPGMLRFLARQAESQLRDVDVDWVFAPGSHVLAFLGSDVPKVLCADATFANVVQQYAEFSDCSAGYLRQGHDQETKALTNCAAAIYPSAWAAQSAVNDYGADPAKVHVVPFGANFDVPSAQSISQAIEQRSFETMRILFIGRDWKRKGGDIVLQAAAIARQHGVPVEIDLVGLDRVPAALPSYVRNHGLLLKSVPQDRHRLERLMRQAHLLFVPSRAENFGMTFCEAAAYGIPSLSTDVGGISTIVRPGISGWCLPLEADAQAYATILEQCFSDIGNYRQLAYSARNFYDSTLTWDAFGDRLMEILQ